MFLLNMSFISRVKWTIFIFHLLFVFCCYCFFVFFILSHNIFITKFFNIFFLIKTLMQFDIQKYAAVSMHMHLLAIVKINLSRPSNPLRLMLLCYTTGNTTLTTESTVRKRSLFNNNPKSAGIL